MKKIIEILSEVTICQSQHFLKNLSFYSSSEAETMLVAHTFEKNLRFEKKLSVGGPEVRNRKEFNRSFIQKNPQIFKPYKSLFLALCSSRGSNTVFAPFCCKLHVCVSEGISQTKYHLVATISS